uniref:RIIa domain-containing protein n=1 Tax=Glossina pallidipes TaxID=7398 RepID=A0A1A9ZK56_GLOPL
MTAIIEQPRVPEGLRELMKMFTKEILKEKPTDLYNFSENYFKAKLLEKDNFLVKDHESIRLPYNFTNLHNNARRYQIAMGLVHSFIPEDITELIKGLIKAILREQPNNLCEFAFQYFQRLNKSEEHHEKHQKICYNTYEDYLKYKNNFLFIPYVKCTCGRIWGEFGQKEPDSNLTGTDTDIDQGTSNRDEINKSENYLKAVCTIQRYFRWFLKRKAAKKSKVPNMSVETAALIIQRCLKNAYRKSSNGNSRNILTKTSTDVAPQLLSKSNDLEVNDNISETASYTSASTAVLLSAKSAGDTNEKAFEKTTRIDEDAENDDDKHLSSSKEIGSDKEEMSTSKVAGNSGDSAIILKLHSISPVFEFDSKNEGIGSYDVVVGSETNKEINNELRTRDINSDIPHSSDAAFFSVPQVDDNQEQMQKNPESEDNFSADAPDNVLNAENEDINNQALKDDVSNAILYVKADSVLEKNSTEDHKHPPIAEPKLKIEEFDNQVPVPVEFADEYSNQSDRKAVTPDIEKSNSKNLDYDQPVNMDNILSLEIKPYENNSVEEDILKIQIASPDQVQEGEDKEEQLKKKQREHILSIEKEKEKDSEEFSNEVEEEESKISENHKLLASGGVQVNDRDGSDISKNSTMRGESESEHDYDSKLNEVSAGNEISPDNAEDTNRSQYKFSSHILKIDEEKNKNSSYNSKSDPNMKNTFEGVVSENTTENILLSTREREKLQGSSLDTELENESNNTKSVKHYKEETDLKSTAKNLEENIHENLEISKETYGEVALDYDNEFINKNNKEAREEENSTIVSTKSLNEFDKQASITFEQGSHGKSYQNEEEDTRKNTEKYKKPYETESGDNIQQKLLDVEQLPDNTEGEKGLKTLKTGGEKSSPQDFTGDAQGHIEEALKSDSEIPNKIYDDIENQSTRNPSEKCKNGSPNQKKEGESPGESGESERVVGYIESQAYIKHDNKKDSLDEDHGESSNETHQCEAENGGDCSGIKSHLKKDEHKKHFPNESYNRSRETEEDESARADDFNECEKHLEDDHKNNLPNDNHKESLHQTEQSEVKQPDDCHDAEDGLKNHQKKYSSDENLKKASHKTEKQETKEIVDCREIEKRVEENHKKSLIRETSKENVHQIEQTTSEKGGDHLKTGKDMKSDPDGKEINSETDKSVKITEKDTGSEEGIKSTEGGEKSRKTDEANEAGIGKQSAKKDVIATTANHLIKTSDIHGASLLSMIPITENVPLTDIQNLEMHSSARENEELSVRENIRSESAATTAIENHVFQTSRSDKNENPEMKSVIKIENESDNNDDTNPGNVKEQLCEEINITKEEKVEKTLRKRSMDDSLHDNKLLKKACEGGTNSVDDADIIEESQSNASDNKVDRSNIKPDDKIVESTIHFSKETEQKSNINDKDTKKTVIIEMERKENQDLDSRELLTNALPDVVESSAIQDFEMIDDKINNNLKINVSESESNLTSRETPVSETGDELSGDSKHMESQLIKASQSGKEILKENVDEVKPIEFTEKNVESLDKNFEGEADPLDEALISPENSNRNGKNKFTNINKGDHHKTLSSTEKGKVKNLFAKHPKSDVLVNDVGDPEFVGNKSDQVLDFEKNQSQLKSEGSLEKPTTETPLRNSKEDNKDLFKDNSTKKSQNDTKRLNTINETYREDLKSHETSDRGGLGCKDKDKNVLNSTTNQVDEETSMIPSKGSTIRIDKTKGGNLEDSNEEPEDDRNENMKNIVDCKSDDSTSHICVDDEKSTEVLNENESNFEGNARSEEAMLSNWKCYTHSNIGKHNFKSCKNLNHAEGLRESYCQQLFAAETHLKSFRYNRNSDFIETDHRNDNQSSDNKIEKHSNNSEDIDKMKPYYEEPERLPRYFYGTATKDSKKIKRNRRKSAPIRHEKKLNNEKKFTDLTATISVKSTEEMKFSNIVQITEIDLPICVNIDNQLDRESPTELFNDLSNVDIDSDSESENASIEKTLTTADEVALHETQSDVVMSHFDDQLNESEAEDSLGSTKFALQTIIELSETKASIFEKEIQARKQVNPTSLEEKFSETSECSSDCCCQEQDKFPYASRECGNKSIKNKKQSVCAALHDYDRELHIASHCMHWPEDFKKNEELIQKTPTTANVDVFENDVKKVDELSLESEVMSENLSYERPTNGDTRQLKTSQALDTCRELKISQAELKSNPIDINDPDSRTNQTFPETVTYNSQPDSSKTLIDTNIQNHYNAYSRFVARSSSNFCIRKSSTIDYNVSQDMIAAVDASEKAINKYELKKDVNVANKSNETQTLNKTFTKITSDDLSAAFKQLDQQRSEKTNTVKNMLNNFLDSERLHSYKVNQRPHFPTNNLLEITKSLDDVLDAERDLREPSVPYEIVEERCIKKTISLIHIDDSDLEIITVQNENDFSDKENVSEDGDEDDDDSLITNAIKLQRNDMIIEKMKQRQESTPKIAKDSVDNTRDINNFEEPSVKHIEGTPDTDEEVVVVNNLQREETRESSAHSDDVIYGNGQKLDLTATKMEGEKQDQAKTFMKSVTIDTAVRYIEPASSNDSFCLDEDTSQTIRRQIMAYSISEADSDYMEERVGEEMSAGSVKSLPKCNDFNINIAVMENGDTSTETESTVVSAATKIQAGARGYLTRKRLGIKNNVNERKTSQKDDSKASFGNAAISESLEHLVRNEAAKKIQNVYRHHRKRNQAHVPGRIEESSERNIDKGNRLAQKRSMLQRGDALLDNSTSSSSSGTSTEKQTEDENAQMVKANTAAMIRAKKIHSHKLKWLAMRQNSMPVQIDSELFRVIPKHMRKRIYSAEANKKKGN